MKVCVITDNTFLFEGLEKILEDPCYSRYSFSYFCSDMGSPSPLADRLPAIRLKDQNDSFFSAYDLFLSLHCKQLFPAAMVSNHRCLNVHPGYNPYHRGWYPQVFSILNGLPAGATIHVIDEKLDHGPIICRQEVPVHTWDTSLDIYKRILQAELDLLAEWLPSLLCGEYETFVPEEDGNLNLRADFLALCELDLNETLSWREAIDRLRALSFAGYRNAFFYDDEGNKIYLDIHLEKAAN